jgi:outer membrane lipoprotein-sorting protein
MPVSRPISTLHSATNCKYIEIMRRALLFSVFAAFSAGVFAFGATDGFAQNPSKAPIQPYVPPQAPLTDVEKADLKRISDYLNTIKSIQGRFTQLAADGRSVQGTFYLRKPGRIRFEYDRPNPILIVADGSSVAVSNSQLKTTDRYPLINSPLRLLLSESIDLTTDRRIADVKKEAGILSFTARETVGPARGSITLVFADSGQLELRQWEVVDAQGMRTTIALNDVRQDANIPPTMFVIQELSPFNKKSN